MTATVADGQINIALIHGVEDPFINAIEVLGGTPDGTPPGVPGTLTASAVSTSQVNLGWGAATDNVGVTGYQVERCAGAGCTTFALVSDRWAATSFNNTGLACVSTLYRYRVRATDAAGNFEHVLRRSRRRRPHRRHPPTGRRPVHPGAVTREAW